MSDKFSDSKKEDLFYQILLYAFYENEQKKWDQLRNKENEILKTIRQEYSNYFEKLFDMGIPPYVLKSEKPLYRARQIKSTDISKLGINISDVIDSYFKIILSKDEIKQFEDMNNSGDLSFSLKHLAMLKTNGMQEFTDEQKEKISKFFMENSGSKVYGFSEKDSRVPPSINRTAGRLNTVSDAYLYVAFEKDTAIHEMRPSINQKYSLAEFRPNKDLHLVDLAGKTYDFNNEYFILSSIIDKISEPNTDNNEVFYHITQHMAHMLQDQGYNGIIYKSALKKGEYNILLFNELDVDFVSSEIVEIQDVNIDYSFVFPFSSGLDSQIELTLKRDLRSINFTVEAFAKKTSDGILVLKGSRIAPIFDAMSSLSKDNQKKRAECEIEDNILKEDVLFKTPSGAAQFVTGKSSNGKTSWKTKDGKSLKEVED